MINVQAIKRECNGRWPGIMSQLGIDVGQGKHGKCPNCGGEDRFRFDDRDGDGGYYCNGCGAGDGISLVRKVLGLNFIAAVELVTKAAGVAIPEPVNQKPAVDAQKIIKGIWLKSSDLTGSDPVSRYLHQRGLAERPVNVRFCPECYESSTKQRLPAMVALVMVGNKTGAIHRTYLDGTDKAKIEKPKKLTPKARDLAGGAIPLFDLKYKDCKGDQIGVAEGIESAIAATQLYGIPTWAAVSTAMLKAFVPPPGVRKVWVMADHDTNFAGQAAAFSLAARLVREDYAADVLIPDTPGDDFCDVTRKMREEQLVPSHPDAV